MEEGIVALLGNATAAGGNDQAGLFAQLCQGFGLPVPESRFAVLGEDIRDGFPCQRDDFFIRIRQGASQFFGKKGSNGGLSAAGHTD